MLQAASMIRASSSSATVLMGQVEILTGYFFSKMQLETSIELRESEAQFCD
jgi:hypothetical protein